MKLLKYYFSSKFLCVYQDFLLKFGFLNLHNQQFEEFSVNFRKIHWWLVSTRCTLESEAGCLLIAGNYCVPTDSMLITSMYFYPSVTCCHISHNRWCWSMRNRLSCHNLKLHINNTTIIDSATLVSSAKYLFLQLHSSDWANVYY